MEFIIEFYKGLDTLNLIIFWGIIIVIILLLIFSIVILNKNKKLKRIINSKISNETKTIEEDLPIIKEENQPKPPEEVEKIIDEVKEIEEEKKFVAEEHIMEYNQNAFLLSNINKETEEKIPSKEEQKKEEIKMPTGPYQRNVLREMSLNQTSPIGIVRQTKIEEKELNKAKELNQNLNEENDVDEYEKYLNEKLNHERIIKKELSQIKENNIQKETGNRLTTVRQSQNKPRENSNKVEFQNNEKIMKREEIKNSDSIMKKEEEKKQEQLIENNNKQIEIQNRINLEKRRLQEQKRIETEKRVQELKRLEEEKIKAEKRRIEEEKQRQLKLEEERKKEEVKKLLEEKKREATRRIQEEERVKQELELEKQISEEERRNDYHFLEDIDTPKTVIKTKESKEKEKYLEEVSKKLAEADKTDDVDRTDYELEQEELAIISYEELMKKKDSIKMIDEEEAVISIEELMNKNKQEEKLYNLTEEEENDKFIRELKDFRNDL